MSFFNIKDLEERDNQIAEYLALKEKLKKRNLQERGELMSRRQELVGNLEPIVASNKKMTNEIVNELTPITNELRELNKKAVRPQLAGVSRIGVKRDTDGRPRTKQRLVGKNYGPLTENFLQKYMDPKQAQVDTTFGIRYEDGVWMIGNKQIKIHGDDDDFTIDGIVYAGTPGLWSLMTDKNPRQFSEEDLARYKEILYETSAMHQNYNAQSPYPRASGSKKWTTILRSIWNEFQLTGIAPSSPIVEEDNSEDDENYHDVSERLDDDDGDVNETTKDQSSGDGVKMYLQKNGHCFALQKCGNGIKFTPRPKLTGIRGNGLYFRVGSSIYNGEGLLLGSRSPFRNIPILGWIL